MISPEKEKMLVARLARLGVKESDITEKFIKSGGPGGQNVNKTSTCVYLRHTPTGIEIKCQQERSQAMNRFLARRLLADKIESRILGKLSEAQQRMEKIRRQKRRRSRRAQQKMLDSKRIQSDKKSLRSSVKYEE